MTALHKLGVAVAVIGAAGPTATLAITEYESHGNAVLLAAGLVAGAAVLVALSAAEEHAEEAARLKARAEAVAASDSDAPAAARTPLFEQPPGAEHDTGFIQGSADGFHRGYAAGYRVGYRTARAPSIARHAAETTSVDMAPIADTQVIEAVVDDTAEQPVQRGRQGADEAGGAAAAGRDSWFTPPARPGHALDGVAASVATRLGQLAAEPDDWFGAAAARQARTGRAA
jgi:hypothetical protein